MTAPSHNWDRRPNRPPRPPGWSTTRRRILERDGGVCYVCGKAGADQVDHKIPVARGGSEDDENLGAIHAKPCHSAKTAREASAGKLKMRRDPEKHPGLW